MQTCSALNYIHSKKIVHADLKPHNVLLHGKDYDVKLADFGISQALSRNYNQLHEMAGSLAYSSPELLSGEPYNEKTDVWALGCLLYEMITLKLAYGGGSEESIRQRIIDKDPPSFSKTVSDDLRVLYDMCMKKDPKERASVKQLLQT